MHPTSHITPSDNTEVLHIQQVQHFAELGRLSASLLHEISNPLTSALLAYEQLDERPELAKRQIKRSLDTMRRYIAAARQQVRAQSDAVLFPVKPQMDQVRRIVAPIARRQRIDLTITQTSVSRLYGDPVKFQQIIVNLILNAIDAYQHDRTSDLRRPVHVYISATPKTLSIKIVDWGQGITQEQLPHLFEPFYTTKQSSSVHGLGIGLTIVKQYVCEDFGGRIRVRSSPRYGTQFTVSIPLPS